MLGEKHDLHHEFPEYEQLIHDLKMNNAHFARLFGDYHEVEHEVRRIEEGVEVRADHYVEDLKKKRLLLKDQLYHMLLQADHK